MKKLILFLLLFFNILNVQVATLIRFIYLNGSNANTVDDKIAFTNGMNTTQGYIKKAFESSEFIQKICFKM